MNQDPQFADSLDECANDAALYALGALDPEKTAAVELRLQSGCPYCVAQVEHYSATAVQLSLSVNPVQPPAELRQRIPNRINTQESIASETEHRKVVRAADKPWIKLDVQGVEIRSLISDKTFMIRMQPGAVFPQHGHPQAEQCYGLSGSVTDSDGLTLHAGDFIVMSRGIQHDPIRSASGCTLLIAYAD